MQVMDRSRRPVWVQALAVAAGAVTVAGLGNVPVAGNSRERCSPGRIPRHPRNRPCGSERSTGEAGTHGRSGRRGWRRWGRRSRCRQRRPWTAANIVLARVAAQCRPVLYWATAPTRRALCRGLRARCGLRGSACRTWRSHHRRLGHLGLDQGLAFAFSDPGPGILPSDLAYLVEAYFDRFPVQHAVPAVDSLPHADGAQLGRGDRGLDAEAVEVLEVGVGYEPRVAAGGGVRCGEDLEVVGCP
jgi:hypothetical protein